MLFYPSTDELDAEFHTLRNKYVSKCKKCSGTGRVAIGTVWDGPIPVTEFKNCLCLDYVHSRVEAFESGLPKNLWEADLIDPEFNIKHFKLMHKLNEDFKDGRKSRALEGGLSLLLTGENGTGKTSSSAVALLGALEGGLTTAMLPWPLVINGLYQNRFQSKIQKDIWSRLMRQFIVIDEIGKETVPLQAKDYVVTILDQIIRRRRGEQLPTILITNHTFQQFSKRYGESISSLISPPYKVLTYKPGDYRRKLVSTWEDF